MKNLYVNSNFFSNIFLKIFSRLNFELKYIIIVSEYYF